MSSGRVVVAPIPSENITITRETLSCAAATSFRTPIAASIQPRRSFEKVARLVILCEWAVTHSVSFRRQSDRSIGACFGHEVCIQHPAKVASHNASIINPGTAAGLPPWGAHPPRRVCSKPSTRYNRQNIMSRRPLPAVTAIFLHILLGLPLSAQRVSNHYAVILSDPAVAQRFHTREALRSVEAQAFERQVELRQQSLKIELARRRFNVVGSVSTFSNAIFVATAPDRVQELESLSGVLGVIPMRTLRGHLNKAVQLMNAPAAWSLLGGVNQAGAGLKIAILDSGIDQTHPAFQDSSLQVPAGFPICTDNHPEDCAYTNNKVIVARSYVRQIAAGTDPNNVAANSMPDDYTPRDRLGHGTATASVAAGNTNTGSLTFSGMAPKAFLGSYKISGSPDGVGTGPTITFEHIAAMAIEDAYKDGMDIASFSYGVLAVAAPLDTGAACGLTAGMPCDFIANHFEMVARAGMVITVSAGNDGYSAPVYPALNMISSPSSAPSVISVGATLNSHVLQPGVSMLDGPSNLQLIPAQTSDLLAFFNSTYFYPMLDVTTLGDDGTACNALPANSLSATIALIRQSTSATCSFSDQAFNAADAGAYGVIFYMANSSPAVPAEVEDSFGDFPNLGTVVVVGNSDGVALKTYINANPGATVLVDPAGTEMDLPTYNQLWSFSPPMVANQLLGFSSPGPNAGDLSIKPDIVAVGGADQDNAPSFPDGTLIPGQSGLYMATQSFDANSDLYNPTGYGSFNGTSFSAPMVAGGAALIKQLHPQLTGAQIKAILMNSAALDSTQDVYGDPVDVIFTGAGRLDAGAAANATVIANVVTSDGSNPVSLAFGALKSTSFPIKKQVKITNLGSASAALTLSFTANQKFSGATLAVDQTSVTVPAGGSATVNVTLSGSLPSGGEYSGFLTIQGTGISIHLPYLFLVPFTNAYEIIPLTSAGTGCFEGLPGSDAGFVGVKLVDASGAPLVGTAVTFTMGRGSAGTTLANPTPQSVGYQPTACTVTTTGTSATCPTDQYGIAYSEVMLSSSVGASPSVTARGAGMTATFGGLNCIPAVLAQPKITSITDASSGSTSAVAGSYIAIKGTSIVDTALISAFDGIGDYAFTIPLPLSLDAASVSFDVPGAYDGNPIDYNGGAGALTFVSVDGGTILVQVPWEVQGASSVQVKVTTDFIAPSNLITVPLVPYAPSMFVNPNDSTIAYAYDLTTQSEVTASSPAHIGDSVEIWANGLGPVNNQPVTGGLPDSSTPATTTTTPTVTVGGKTAKVTFSGLDFNSIFDSPYLVQYGVAITVPSGATGSLPVVLSIGGVDSAALPLPVAR